VPAGTYQFRTIQLNSGVSLRLESGARQIASRKREDYRPIGHDHNEMGEVHSGVFAIDAPDLCTCGRGQ
jgi:polygalacturonase